MPEVRVFEYSRWTSNSGWEWMAGQMLEHIMAGLEA
jgi:hypothetical protein